jgi:acetyl esterase/lipase
MASWQAHVVVWILKRRLKRRLVQSRNVGDSRRILRPPPFHVPANVTIRQESIGGVPGEWVESSSAANDLLLYLHGGGYFACSPKTHRAITTSLAQHGFRVYVPDYRLAPEHVFPAALDDAMAVYRALLADDHLPRRLVIAGDSAGGGLALALMVAARDAGFSLPAAAGLFSPWTDLAATGASLGANSRRCAMFDPAGISPTAAMYLGKADPRNPLASPLYADLSGLPPLLIHVGRDEVLLDDSTRLADRARAAAVKVELQIWPVVPHTWQLVPRLPEARRSLRQAADFLRAPASAGAAIA